MSIHQAKSLSHRVFRGLLRGFERSVSMVSRTAYMKMAVEIVEDLDRVIEVDTGKQEGRTPVFLFGKCSKIVSTYQGLGIITNHRKGI